MAGRVRRNVACARGESKLRKNIDISGDPSWCSWVEARRNTVLFPGNNARSVSSCVRVRRRIRARSQGLTTLPFMGNTPLSHDI